MLSLKSHAPEGVYTEMTTCRGFRAEEEGDVSKHIWEIKQKDKVIEIGPQVRGTKQEF